MNKRLVEFNSPVIDERNGDGIVKAILALLAAAQQASTQDQALIKDGGDYDLSDAIVQQPQINLTIQKEAEAIDQQKSAELVKLIRKLRWIGMEREAGVVSRALIDRFGKGEVDLSPSPADTD